MTRIVLVTGSRALAKGPAMRDANIIIEAMVWSLGDGSIVVAGDADGPDEWAMSVATSSLTALQTRIYGLDGWVKDAAGKQLRRWTDAEKFGPLDRNAAMVRDVAKQARRGATVQVLALEAAWSATKGTAHTLGKARAAGLPITRITFERGN